MERTLLVGLGAWLLLFAASLDWAHAEEPSCQIFFGKPACLSPDGKTVSYPEGVPPGVETRPATAAPARLTPAASIETAPPGPVTTKVDCVLPDASEVSLSKKQCRTLKGVINPSPQQRPDWSAVEERPARVQTAPAFVPPPPPAPEPAFERVPAQMPIAVPVRLYKVRCIQTTLGGGYYFSWITLRYQPTVEPPCNVDVGPAYYYARPPILGVRFSFFSGYHGFRRR